MDNNRKRKKGGDYSDRHIRRLIQKETERSTVEGQSFYLSPNDSVQIQECSDNNDTRNADSVQIQECSDDRDTNSANEKPLVIENNVIH